MLDNVNMEMQAEASIIDASVFGLEVNISYVDANLDASEEMEQFAGIEPMVANAFMWNSSTLPFNPANMQATTDVDIVWNQFANGQFTNQFDLWGTGLGSMVAAQHFNARTQQDYVTSRNEGHINDFFGIFGQPHTYVSFNSVNPYITIFAGNRVRALVFNANGNLVFDSGHGTNGNSRSPAAGAGVVTWNHGSAVAFGQSRDMYFLQVQPGTYFVAFMNYNLWPLSPNYMDNLSNGFYYAFYTGMPLPAQRSFREVAHSGTVQRANAFTSSTTSGIRQFTFSANRPNWYAINGVRFDQRPIIGHFLVDRVVYEYRAPNSSAFWRSVETNRPTMAQELIDWNPATGSIIGTWQFRFTTHWASNAQTGNISAMSAVTSVIVDYLVPFGSGL